MKTHKKSIALSAVFLVVGFTLGAWWGSSGYNRAQGKRALPGQMRTRGGVGASSGTIHSNDGSSITVTLTEGGSKIVFLNASTTITKATRVASTDLAQDTPVSFFGLPNPDGSVTANTIQIIDGLPRIQRQ